MLVTVKPVGTVVAVTTKLPAAVSVSLTVATVETMPLLPRWRVSAAPAVMLGALLLTVRVKVASVVAPQLSVARMVIAVRANRCGIADRDHAR